MKVQGIYHAKAKSKTSKSFVDETPEKLKPKNTSYKRIKY